MAVILTAKFAVHSKIFFLLDISISLWNLVLLKGTFGQYCTQVRDVVRFSNLGVKAVMWWAYSAPPGSNKVYGVRCSAIAALLFKC